MSKVKLTQEQANSIKSLRENSKFSFEDFMHCYIKQTFSKENISLLALDAEDFAKALLIGYEIKKPEPPIYNTEKFNVCFNNSVQFLEERNAFFIGFKNSGRYTGYNSFSIGEATEIRDALDALLQYYNQFVKQGDNNVL
jgi:hypothetical protein